MRLFHFNIWDFSKGFHIFVRGVYFFFIYSGLDRVSVARKGKEESVLRDFHTIFAYFLHFLIFSYAE